jgi:hypothetical protein
VLANWAVSGRWAGLVPVDADEYAVQSEWGVIARVLAPDGVSLVMMVTLMRPGEVIVDAGDHEKQP